MSFIIEFEKKYSLVLQIEDKRMILIKMYLMMQQMKFIKESGQLNSQESYYYKILVQQLDLLIEEIKLNLLNDRERKIYFEYIQKILEIKENSGYVFKTTQIYYRYIRVSKYVRSIESGGVDNIRDDER